MEKISGILPATARVTTVDLKNSGVARPGGPSFGREVGMSSPAKRALEAEKLKLENKFSAKDMSTAQKALGAHQEVMTNRDANANKDVQTIQEMADKFFLSQRQPKADVVAFPAADADSDLVPDTSNFKIADEFTRGNESLGKDNSGADDVVATDDLRSTKSTPDLQTKMQISALAAENKPAVNAAASTSTQAVSEDDAPVVGRYIDVQA